MLGQNLACEGGQVLERASVRCLMPRASKCSRGIWVISSSTCFNFWLGLRGQAAGLGGKGAVFFVPYTISFVLHSLLELSFQRCY